MRLGKNRKKQVRKYAGAILVFFYENCFMSIANISVSLKLRWMLVHIYTCTKLHPLTSTITCSGSCGEGKRGDKGANERGNKMERVDVRACVCV